METFTTKLSKKETDMYYNPNNMDIANVDALIEWNFEIEKRDWGIKNVLMYVDKVNITIVYEDDDMKQHEETLDLSDWKIESNLDINIWCPQALELDFKKKEVTIS